MIDRAPFREGFAICKSLTNDIICVIIIISKFGKLQYHRVEKAQTFE